MTNQPTTCTRCNFGNMNIVGWLFIGGQRLCPKCRNTQLEALADNRTSTAPSADSGIGTRGAHS
jgi:hypothetical protein